MSPPFDQQLPHSKHASEQQSPLFTQAESHQHIPGACPAPHEVAAQPQSLEQLWCVSSGSQVPSPQKPVGPQEPHHEQASAQQSPLVAHCASQKQPPGAWLDPHTVA